MKISKNLLEMIIIFFVMGGLLINGIALGTYEEDIQNELEYQFEENDFYEVRSGLNLYGMVRGENNFYHSSWVDADNNTGLIMAFKINDDEINIVESKELPGRAYDVTVDGNLTFVSVGNWLHSYRFDGNSYELLDNETHNNGDCFSICCQRYNNLVWLADMNDGLSVYYYTSEGTLIYYKDYNFNCSELDIDQDNKVVYAGGISGDGNMIKSFRYSFSLDEIINLDTTYVRVSGDGGYDVGDIIFLSGGDIYSNGDVLGYTDGQGLVALDVSEDGQFGHMKFSKDWGVDYTEFSTSYFNHIAYNESRFWVNFYGISPICYYDWNGASLVYNDYREYSYMIYNGGVEKVRIFYVGGNVVMGDSNKIILYDEEVISYNPLKDDDYSGYGSFHVEWYNIVEDDNGCHGDEGYRPYIKINVNDSVLGDNSNYYVVDIRKNENNRLEYSFDLNMYESSINEVRVLPITLDEGDYKIMVYNISCPDGGCEGAYGPFLQNLLYESSTLSICSDYDDVDVDDGDDVIVDEDNDGLDDEEQDYKILLGMGMCGVFGVILSMFAGMYGFFGGVTLGAVTLSNSSLGNYQLLPNELGMIIMIVMIVMAFIAWVSS